MVDLVEQLHAFTNMHDEFQSDWNEAMKSGDTSALDRMTEDYYVAFFNSGKEKPMFFNKADSISGMEQSVQHFLGAEKKFDNRVIRMRNSENAVVFYELLVVKEENVLARLFTIENWMLIEGKWMIVRETEEPIS
ncbi:MAG TPA: hypothetical protein VNR38_08560 [Ureibacillus sp.]|nr:hypothetical protein [Ureibacillus sp.]